MESNHATEISLVIPTYRKAAQLEATLAALEQGPQPERWEIVVVDDGSGDATTARTLLRFRDRLPLVDASLDRNHGRAAARNHGWRQACGRVVLFVDDDIVLDPGAVVAHLRAQRERPGVYIANVVTAPEIVDSRLFDYLDSRGIAKTPAGAVCPARYFLTQNASVPRRALDSIGGFDEDFVGYGFEDMELAFRLEDEVGLDFFHLGGARGVHVHHHSLEQYLAKKVECGQSTLPRIAALHPHRVGEMHLDVLPSLRAEAPWGRRLEGAVVDLMTDTSLDRALSWTLIAFGSLLPRRVTRRLLDLLVLASYARGLRQKSTTE